MDNPCHATGLPLTKRIPPADRKISLRVGQLHETRYAVLVNDMLNDFVHGKLRSNRASHIIPKIKALLEAARKKDIPIFYCNDEHEISDPELKIWGPHAIKFTPGSKVIQELEPRSTDFMVPKRSYGSFDNTNLDKLLRSVYEGQGANTLIITGIHTHICVKHTAYGGFIRGFNMIIPEDSVTAFTEENHKSGLQYITENYGATIKRTSTLLNELE
ncbi:MAG: cysteine hydrolase family protein [Nitrososphaeraceae archaeon]